MKASMDDIASITDRALAKLKSTLPARESKHPEGLGADNWKDGTFYGEIQGFTAEPKVGWISRSVMRDGATGGGRAAVLLLMGPSYETPHLLASLTLEPERLRFSLDCPARVDVAGNKDYLAGFYASVEPWRAKLLANPLVTVGGGPEDLSARTLRSPGAVDAWVPAGDPQGLALVQTAVEELVDRWCGWIGEAKEVNRMQRGSMFARDTQMQRLRFASLYGQFAPTLGKDRARQLASATVGPGDEMYVGSAGDNSE